MHCPMCSGSETKVVDSRMATDGTLIRRRRSCDACEHRFSTVEEVELLDLCVVKRDGSRQAYSRGKIEEGLRRALYKRNTEESDFRSLMYGIEREIQKESGEEITTVRLGEIVLRCLRDFDQVAYIRFASVYRSFSDVESFTKELEGLV
ncbi:MAG: transcriptional regulator NrdR [bacterium]|nr:transcriptional regulator NrdR [bacterium]